MPEAAMQALPSDDEALHRCEALEAELRETVTRLNRVQEELNWKTAFMEAQVNSTIDGIIVVDPQGRNILQNQRVVDLFQIPRHIADDPDDSRQVRWATDMTRHPAQFVEKVVHLYSHPDEFSHDEIELKNGTVLDRYSSPVRGKDGTRYGRIWTFHDITKRKRAEAALQASQSRLRNLIDGMGPAVFAGLLTPQGILVEVNQSALTAGGLKAEDVLGRPFDQTPWWSHSPEAQQHLREAIARAALGESSRYDVRTQGVGDQIIDLDFSLQPLRDETGEVVFLIPSASVITERTEAQAALRIREEQLRAALLASGTGTFRWDIHTNELDWDEALDALFGLPPGQTVRSLQTFIAAVHPADRSGVIARCERCEKEGADFDMEFRVLWPDGSLHWLDDKGKTSFDTAGKPLYMTGACVDITARKEATEALRSSEEKFRQLADNINDVFWITSPDFQVIHYISQAYEEIWGRSPASLHANPHQWVEAILPEEREAVLAVFATLMGDAPTVSVEYRIARPDGSLRWIHDRGFQIRDASGSLIRLTGISSDITARKENEEAMQKQQTELRILFDLMPAMIWFKDTHNGFLKVNQRVAEATGLPITEIEGKTAEEIFPKEAAGYYADDLEVIHSKAPKMGIVEKLQGPEGQELWVRTDKMPVCDKEGKVTGLIAMVHDITESRRAEEALRESEERFVGAFEHAPIGVALASPEGRWLKVNRALCRLVGFTEAELLTRTFQDITHPDDLAADLECVRQILADEIRSYQLEKRYIHAAGHLVTILLNVSLVRDGQGQPRYFIAQIQDISERKKTEESLRLLSSAVKQSKESIMITEAQLDLPGPKIIFVNPAFTEMTGYTATEVLGLTPRLLQGPRTDREVLNRLRHNLEQGDTFAGETVNYRKDGTEFDLEWQIAPLRNADCAITHFVAIQRDITGRKRLEAQLIQSQKMETVGKLAGGIAHEFNSILTAIIGQSELLLVDLPAGSPLTGKVTAINQAAGRAAILTRQLLAYGRKQTLQPEMLNLNAVLAGMAGTVRHLVGHGVDIRSVPAAGLRAVQADAGQITQVIMNMVINANDAMPGGGKLTLETANVTLDQSSVERYPELKPGDYVMLAISDTGTGMSPAVQARVFEPFFSTKGMGEGTGLGLSTCYGIIKQSGGHITVYSEPDRGTTFKIYLPQVAAAPVSLVQRTAAPGLPRGTETILLVEDDPSLREMAGALLQRLGYTVLTAANGIEALSLLDTQLAGHIDLLFTDVVMPQMSGKELADRVQVLSPGTRTLFTSAYTANAIVHQGVLNQGVALLQKPFTPSALAQKLREVLAQ
ncbi:MAG: multi-sensor hybrid histidine kinase [Prosthecobacter sp.]|nr:multi-sensor hybrid histidine kinase [Prosthecobacter sp.]